MPHCRGRGYWHTALIELNIFSLLMLQLSWVGLVGCLPLRLRVCEDEGEDGEESGEEHGKCV